MKKAKQLVRKPLLITSICLIVTFILGLIIMGAVPYAEATYKYKWSKYIEIKIEVEDDEVTLTNFNYGKVKINEYDSMIKNGKLYIKEDPSKSEYTELGEINSYKLRLTNQDENTAIPLDLVLECKLTQVLRIINIVMICIGGLGLATSLTIIVCDKINSKKSQNDSTEKA